MGDQTIGDLNGHATPNGQTNGHGTTHEHLNGHGTTNGTLNGHTAPEGPSSSENGSNGKNGELPPEPIAIVGMALRLPGEIHSAEALWQLLINKKNTRRRVPTERYNLEGFYSPKKGPGSIISEHGHFLADTDSLEHLDTSFFSMSKAEVERLDPQQRMLLEVVWECMENAGQTGWRGTNTGVFVGTWGDVGFFGPYEESFY